MKYNFDKIVDRTKTNEKHWNLDFLEKKFGIDRNKKLFPLWIGDTDFACPPNVLEVIRKKTEEGIFGYSFLPSDWNEKIIEWNKKLFNSNIKEEEIILSYGTVISIYQAVKAFTKIGESVIINTPVYGPFEEAVNDNDRKIIKNKLVYKNKKYNIDFDLLEKQISENNVKLYILCNPHNPGCHLWTHEDLQKIINICIKHQVIIFSDEVHRDLVFKDKQFYSLYNFKNQYDAIIIATSPNKAFNFGGLKTSYLIVESKKYRDILKKEMQSSRITSPNSFGGIALVEAYKSYDWLIEVKSYIERNYNYLKNEIESNLKKVEVFESEASFFLYLNFKNLNISQCDFENEMIKNNIILNYESDFVCDGEFFARINVGTSFELVKDFSALFTKIVGKLENA